MDEFLTAHERDYIFEKEEGSQAIEIFVPLLNGKPEAKKYFVDHFHTVYYKHHDYHQVNHLIDPDRRVSGEVEWIN
jgi:hypothetical protein